MYKIWIDDRHQCVNVEITDKIDDDYFRRVVEACKQASAQFVSYRFLEVRRTRIKGFYRVYLCIARPDPSLVGDYSFFRNLKKTALVADHLPLIDQFSIRLPQPDGRLAKRFKLQELDAARSWLFSKPS